ncbi:DnaJ domain-containing protein [Fluviicola sp.]|uniref:J domain-containing protein n=1 Tax=Fluviicola sp. TaxID=1917219 RepID=UPI00283A9909|nr:DnaJ domain-containing protein [Fluviicola sp.]
MRKNSTKSFEKQLFVVVYIHDKFKIDSLEIAHELDLVNETSIHVRSVANWIVRKMTDTKDRADLVDFLMNLVFADGDMIDREFTALIRLGELIGVRSIYIENKIIEFRKRIFGQANNARLYEIANSGTRRKFALAILSLSSNATNEAIKKRYRTLAKRYHPDSNPGLSQEEMMENAQRFLEVQDAYEELISD